MWRQKLGAFCRMLSLTSDNYQEHLKEWFGRNWVYQLRPLIESIKLAEFSPEEESRASLRVAWIIAVNERERRCNRKRRDATAVTKRWVADSFPVKPSWGSWIERTTKEDA
jgi:hypothetical protein